MIKGKRKKRLIKTVLIILAFLVLYNIFEVLIIKNFIYPKKFESYVEKYADLYEIDENYIYAVIKCESNFDVLAHSNKNARGLMQISEQTGMWAAEEIGIENYDNEKLFDPDVNINIGTWYFKRLLNQYGDVYTAAAAYNAGSGNVSSWLKNEKYSHDGKTIEHIPFRETTIYVKKVENAISAYNYLYK